MTNPKDPDQGTPEADWAEAMAEQASVGEESGTKDSPDQKAPGEDAGGQDTPVQDSSGESALDEQAATTATEPATDAPRNAGGQVFKPLEQGAESAGARDLEMIMEIPVKFTVELGRTRLTIKQLLELTQGSVVELDGLAGEPMDILINGYLIAQGEVVVVEDRYGIRITEIITPSERVQKLNR